MNPEALLTHYLNKYQITLTHPEHGLIILTSSIWADQPALQGAVQQAIAGLNGVQAVLVASPEQLTVRYDSRQLRQLNPLSLMALERKLRQQYRQAGY